MAHISKVPTGIQHCSIIHAFKSFWVHYFDFKNRSTRSEYWWATLCYLIMDFILMICIMMIFSVNSTAIAMKHLSMLKLCPFNPIIIILLIWNLGTIIPSLAIETRRLNDLGLSTKVSIPLVVILTLIFIISKFAPGIGFLTSIIGIIVFILSILPTNVLTKQGHELS